MLDQKRITKIAREIAVATLAPKNVEKVLSKADADFEGRDVLRITIVIPARAVSRISGDAAIDTLFGINKRLQEEGEERFAHVEYATAAELREDGD